MPKSTRSLDPAWLCGRFPAVVLQRGRVALRISLIPCVVALSPQSAHAQEFSVFASPLYGFGAGTVPSEHKAGNTHGATGWGWQTGGVYDGMPDTKVHGRIRLGWSRNFWTEDFESTAQSTDYGGGGGTTYSTTTDLGTVTSRMDLAVVTPLCVIPVGGRCRVVLGAELALLLRARVHEHTTSTYVSDWYGPHSYQHYEHESETDTTWSGTKELNPYHLSLPIGLEMSVLNGWRIGAEYSVGVSRFTMGGPPRYARLVLSYVFGYKAPALAPGEN